MNKDITFFCFTFLYLFSTLVIFAEQYRKSDICNLSQHMRIESSPEEGFLSGTLIKTPYGHISIENVAMGDVVIDSQGNATEVVAITKRLVDKYIKIILHNTVVCLGSDQLLHFDTDSVWKKACEMPDIEYIYDSSILYALTTNNHTLCVTFQDIPAHNAEMLLSTMGTHLGYIAIGNPIVAVLGSATIALTVVAYNAQQEHAQKYKESLVAVSDTIILADRFYYISRKNDLEKILKELLTIKNDLENIHGLYSGCFTHQFLHNRVYSFSNNIALPNIDREKQLSDEQRSQLRKMREHELTLIERQIEDTQLLLALHVNQLLTNIEIAQKSYDSATGEIQEAIAFWNNNLEAMTPEIALRLYKWDLLREHLLYIIRRTCDELLLVDEYYRACRSKCIQLSTTIMITLDHIVPTINEKRKSILQEEVLARNNSAIIERYFAARNISVQIFKNAAQKEFNEQQKQREIEALKKIEIQQQQINSDFGGGPKKDDDEEGKDESKDLSTVVQISKDDAPHMFGDRPGHLRDTPANRKLLIDLASNKKNFLGIDSYGTEWYAKIMRDGRQLWATVRNCVIRNGGVNNIPREFHPRTGLCKPFK